MELVAMDMKLRGQYIARQLSFKGTSFKVDEVAIPKDFYRVYNESVRLVSGTKVTPDVLHVASLCRSLDAALSVATQWPDNLLHCWSVMMECKFVAVPQAKM